MYNFTLNEVLAAGAGKEKKQAIIDIMKTDERYHESDFAEKLYIIFDKQIAEAYDTIDVLPQPGSEELFKFLHEKDIRVILNTGYNRATALSLLKKLNWQEGEQTDALITATDVGKNRPLPDMILLAMEKFSILHASEVVKVGDLIIDIEEGQNAGCGLSIGITTGAHTAAQLETANPDYIIGSLKDLPAVLNLTV